MAKQEVRITITEEARVAIVEMFKPFFRATDFQEVQVLVTAANEALKGDLSSLGDALAPFLAETESASDDEANREQEEASGSSSAG